MSIEDNTFKLVFKDDWLQEGDLIYTGEAIQAEILEKPHRKWWKLLLQFITLRFYAAPWEYKVRYIKHTNKQN